ncbi:MAG: RnfH family protein [Burkholderiaceae bacterium]|jgi:putative ubiquitin-RnfH superfamily antitoxin RatB of RatAB toxin-antitoxin module|nr:RnfH family protein [Burkholderiaceae bacterium]MCU0928700.1 RnfH family protein [Burkholderiaceae bacterium]
MRVEVVYCPAPRIVHRRALDLPPGSTVDDAVAASGLLDGVADDVRLALSLSVWGRVQPTEHVLRDRDRVEVCRALVVDPKEARRLRYKRAEKGSRAR